MFPAVKTMQQLLDRQAFTDCMTQPDPEKTWKNVVKVPPGFVVAFNLVDTNQLYPFDVSRRSLDTSTTAT
ncbi:hypothetical protein U9M48_009213 [Paspalum notatum var. saurae]|uniref:Uncharacterized protein n=1 Tax=Paspalum notatum var. saurae TaxID=547442 RepID=A0AAQ3SQU7_PASNO